MNCVLLYFVQIRVHKASDMALSPIQIQSFVRDPSSARRVCSAAQPALIYQTRSAVTQIDVLRHHLLQPGCQSIRTYLHILRMKREQLLFLDPNTIYPMPNEDDLHHLIRNEFPIIALGNRTVRRTESLAISLFFTGLCSGRGYQW